MAKEEASLRSSPTYVASVFLPHNHLQGERGPSAEEPKTPGYAATSPPS